MRSGRPPLSVGRFRGVAPAKLNLRLRIIGRRPDGYHLLDSIVVPVSLFDHLTVDVSPSHTAHVSIRCWPEESGLDAATNLAARAATLFLERTGSAADVQVALAKRIPIGAGLGGGSSDAAAVLRGLNLLLRPPVPTAVLREWAVELGADVPFFLYGRQARMGGIGERIEPIEPVLMPTVPILIAFPGVALDTRGVYRAYDDSLTSIRPISSIRPPTSRQEPPQELLINDLEAAAFQVCPGVRSLRRQLVALGAAGVLMTGSGSAVFGLWRHWDDAHAARRYLRAAGTWAHVAQVLQDNPTFEVFE